MIFFNYKYLLKRKHSSNPMNLKVITIFILFISNLISIAFNISPLLMASEIKEDITSQYVKKIPDNNFYILGPGDIFSLVVGENTSLLDAKISIDGEGTSLFQRLGRLYISGLTIEELKTYLNKEYANFVNEPDVQIRIVSYRPIKVSIDGELNEPGDLIFKSLNVSSSGEEADEFIYDGFFPSVTDAIRRSKGLTVFSDLKNVTITRINPITKGGGRIKTKIDLMKVLNLSDPSQNIRLMDGDTVFIPKSSEPILSQITKAIKSNLNPKFINVFVAGRVSNPGLTKVNKVSVLNDALQISGGTKLLKGPVRFIRYRNDGTIDQRKFKFNNLSPRGSYKNPFLEEGDLIYIGKSKFNIASEILNELTSPLAPIVTGYGFFKILD